MNSNTKTLLSTVAGLLFTGAVGLAQQGVHTPKPGSPEREAIMDVMRIDAYCNTAHPAITAHRNPDKVFFKVYFLKVHGDWALTDVFPVDAAGKEIAEPRWGLLHRKSGRWSDVDYNDALEPYIQSQKDGDDALDMTPSTVRKLWRVFPDAPRDIFPKSENDRITGVIP